MSFFFFDDTAPTEIYTLSLHDALPISRATSRSAARKGRRARMRRRGLPEAAFVDRKSTRLNSSHVSISYAVFCLKKKKTTNRSIHAFQCFWANDSNKIIQLVSCARYRS